ncbi:MAG TPA: O-antigen ligase family protein [Patescibacteria group bacterium]|nr:O-antigen ligase family protein [Patescibacteria group bacterium]
MDRITKYLGILFIASLPLYVIRWSFFGYPTTFLELLFFLFLVSYLLQKRKEKKFHFHLPVLLIGGILVVSATISLFVSPDFLGGLGIWKAYFIEPFIFFICLYDYISCKPQESRLFFWAYVFSGVWVGLYALYQWFTGSNPFAPHEAQLGRVSAVYNTANAIGLYYGPILSLLMGALIRTPKKAFVPILLSVFFLLVLVLTKSRGTFLGLLALEVFMLFSYVNRMFPAKRVLIRGIVSVLIIATVVGSIFFLQSKQKEAHSVTSTYRGSDTFLVRTIVWETSYRMIKDNPILGVGLDGFRERYLIDYRPSFVLEDFQYPHNLILTLWLETGILGVLSFLFLLIFVTQMILKKDQDFLGWGITGGFLYLFVHGLVDVPYFKNDLSMAFWLLIAFATSYPKIRDYYENDDKNL